MDSNILSYVGYRLYQTERIKELKRYLVFRARCAMHGDIMHVNRTPCQGQFLKVGPLVLDSSTILVPLKWTFGNCLSEGP